MMLPAHFWTWPMLEWVTFALTFFATVLRTGLAWSEWRDYRRAHQPTEKVGTMLRDLRTDTTRDLIKAPIGVILTLWGLVVAVWRLYVPDIPTPPTDQQVIAFYYFMIIPIGLTLKSFVDYWARWKLQKDKRDTLLQKTAGGIREQQRDR